MTGRDDDKLQVQQATDIVRLVGEQVALRPKGREFVGLCPFHDDRKPSMYVAPAKQIYKCFSCGTGGDVFSFVMNYHKMTFPEALAYLAERAGIELRPARGGAADEGPSDRQRLIAVNELALAFFRELLAEDRGKTARDYIAKRGISEAMVNAFALGYAPDAWDALAGTIARRGWDVKGFELAGLISPRKSGEGNYDRLRHRLIFPIFDASGRPIAFGGRKLREEDEPKYLNSPETRLFNKSATLYGLHLAKKPIIDAHTAVIVEGYTDVIACHQAGLGNVVATLGTALTGEHVTQLRRYAERIVLIFDPDEAGQKAADRAVEVFLTGDVDVAIATLPGGLDPADLLAQRGGIEQWREALAGAQDALAYQFAQVSAQIQSTDTVTGRQHAIEQYLQRLGRFDLQRNGSVRWAFVVQHLSELLRIDERQVQALMAAGGPRSRPAASQGGATGPQSGENENYVKDGFAPGESGNKLKAIRLAERQVIGCLLRRNGLFNHALADGRSLEEAILPEEIVTPENRRVYERIYHHLAQGDGVSLTSLLGELAAGGEQDLANLVIAADTELDQAIGAGDEKRIEHVLEAAGEKIRRDRSERDYRQQRGELSELAKQDIAAVDRRLREHLSRPNPVRIARTGAGLVGQWTTLRQG